MTFAGVIVHGEIRSSQRNRFNSNVVKDILALKLILTRGERRRCAAILFLMLVGATLELMLVGAIPAAVALLADRNQIAKVPVIRQWESEVREASDASLMLWMALLIGLLAFLKMSYFFAVHRFVLRTMLDVRVRLSSWMFECYLYAPWTFHLDHHSSELLRNATTEINELVNGVIQPLLNALYAVVMIGFILAMIVAALPVEALFAFAVTIAAAGLLLVLLRKNLSNQGEFAKHERKRMLGHVQEGLANLVDARILGRESWFLDRFLVSARNFSRSQNQIAFVSRMLPYAVEFVSITGLLLVVVLLVSQSDDLRTALPQVTLIGVGLVRIRQSVSLVASSAAQIQYSLPSLTNVREHTEGLESQLEQRDDTRERCRFQDLIEVDDVHFTYPGREISVLGGIDLRIRKGASVAFVGATGCGKSTLLHILLGTLTPTRGSVRVDGVPIDAQLRRWRNNIGYVSQQIHLLDATIEENIVVGDAAVDHKRLCQAIKIAQLDDVIAEQPRGLATVVGENGARLSGGQRQRIGLARALYREPEVIVLDEATSALDYGTEAAIARALNEIPWTATKIIVAHRLSTVQNCDMIVMLSRGRVLDRGSFAELSARHSTLAEGVAG